MRYGKTGSFGSQHGKRNPETPHHPLPHTPEMQKAAVSGLIEEIVVQPTADQYSFDSF